MQARLWKHQYLMVIMALVKEEWSVSQAKVLLHSEKLSGMSVMFFWLEGQLNVFLGLKIYQNLFFLFFLNDFLNYFE